MTGWYAPGKARTELNEKDTGAIAERRMSPEKAQVSGNGDDGSFGD